MYVESEGDSPAKASERKQEIYMAYLLLPNMLTGKSVALLNHGVEEITRRVYTALNLFMKSILLPLMANNYQPLTALPWKIFFAAALTSSDW